MSEKLENDIIEILRQFSKEDGHNRFTSSQRMVARDIIQMIQLGGMDAFSEHYKSIRELKKERDAYLSLLNKYCVGKIRAVDQYFNLI